MSDFFRVCWEQPDDSGAAPVDSPEPDAPDTETPEAEVAAPVTFTADQLAEHLPQFADRFLAHHDPTEALKLYGERDRNVQAALTRYTQGAPTDADLDTLREGGYEIPEQVEEPVEPLWGAPWAEPTTMDEFDRIASERPWDALAFVDANPGRVNDDKRREVLDYWAQHDRAGAIAYETNRAEERALANAKAYADEQLAAMRQEFQPLQERSTQSQNAERNAKLAQLVTLANTRVPDFAEHQEGVQAMVKRYADTYGVDYFDNLLALPIEQQLDHMTEMTGAVAWRGRPAAEAQAAAEVAQTDAAKIAAGGQRGRGAAGSNGDGISKAQREFNASFERLRDVDVPIH